MDEVAKGFGRLLLFVLVAFVAVILVSWVISFAFVVIVAAATSITLLVDGIFGATLAPAYAVVAWLAGGAAIGGSITFFYKAPLVEQRDTRAVPAAACLLLAIVMLLATFNQ